MEDALLLFLLEIYKLLGYKCLHSIFNLSFNVIKIKIIAYKTIQQIKRIKTKK